MGSKLRTFVILQNGGDHMKFLSKLLGLALTLTMLAPALAKTDTGHDREEVVKYVQGGACVGGNGAKRILLHLLQMQSLQHGMCLL